MVVHVSSTKKRRDRIRVVWVTQMDASAPCHVSHSAQGGKLDGGMVQSLRDACACFSTIGRLPLAERYGTPYSGVKCESTAKALRKQGWTWRLPSPTDCATQRPGNRLMRPQKTEHASAVIPESLGICQGAGRYG